VTTKRTFAPETFGKERKLETYQVLSLLPGSHKPLTLRETAGYVPETWGQMYYALPWGAQDMRKREIELDSCTANKGAKKLVGSDCAKNLK
jgi:hypothetical protein